MRGALAVALVVAALSGGCCLPCAWGADGAAQAPTDQPEVVVAGSWGAEVGQFGFHKEEGDFGPGCFAIDAVGQVYVGDTFNRRLQVFKPDGSFFRAIPTGQTRWMSIDDICIRRDWNIYVTDGSLLYRYTPGGTGLTQPEGQPRLPGQTEPRALPRLAAVVEGEANDPGFYFQQGSPTPLGGGGPFVNKYDAKLQYQASVQAYDLCADVEGRHVCAILGSSEEQPVAGLRVLVIDVASGGRRFVEIPSTSGPAKAAHRRLVGCDREGRLYLLTLKTSGDATSGRVVAVYDGSGRHLASISLERCGSRDLFMGGAYDWNVRVGSEGDLFVASATLKEGYRIDRYTWREP